MPLVAVAFVAGIVALAEPNVKLAYARALSVKPLTVSVLSSKSKNHSSLLLLEKNLHL